MCTVGVSQALRSSVKLVFARGSTWGATIYTPHSAATGAAMETAAMAAVTRRATAPVPGVRRHAELAGEHEAQLVRQGLVGWGQRDARRDVSAGV